MGMEREQLRAIRGQLENRAMDTGVRFFGVADLTGAQETIVEQGDDFLAAFPRSISLGIALNDGIVEIAKKFMGFFPTNCLQGLRDWVGLAQVVS